MTNLCQMFCPENLKTEMLRLVKRPSLVEGASDLQLKVAAGSEESRGEEEP